MGEIFLDDGDVRLYQGDVETVLAGMPDESVDCVVTSPPYWGLRDYGTGLWDGGDPDCDHLKDPGGGDRHGRYAAAYIRPETGKPTGGSKKQREEPGEVFHDVCGKCGASRVDQQLGLEPTPDQYVERMVAVFREIRRVLAAHGTCWVNLGDSYAANTKGSPTTSLTPEQEAKLGKKSAWLSGNTTPVEHPTKPKDLVGIPWRVAFALQADGWWLRADIIWAKPNPMPESVTDRPTKAHEYVFLLTKAPRYYFDAEAVREKSQDNTWRAEYPTYAPKSRKNDADSFAKSQVFNEYRSLDGGRNVRSVWQIATQPYPEAHFATYPEELVRRCVLAGCPERVCRVCGKPSERIVQVEYERLATRRATAKNLQPDVQRLPGDRGGIGAQPFTANKHVETLGWSDCGHNDWRTGVVLDPFIGSGTTCKVARDHGRHSIGIDLSADYLSLAAHRLQQLSLLT